MHEAGSDLPNSSSRKIPVSKSRDSLPRHVRFDDKSKKHQLPSTPPLPDKSNGDGDGNKTTTAENKNTQPDSHPQLGSGLPFLNRPPTWYTAADPTRSVNCQPTYSSTTASGAVLPSYPFPHPLTNQQQQQQHAQHFVQPGVPYAHPYQCQTNNNMADYQNCAAPHTGVNFQPPVPDTTYGPIQHLYVPRFDGSFQVGYSSPFVPTVAVAAAAPAYGHVPGQQAYAISQPSYMPMPGSQPVMVNGQVYMPAVQGMPGQQHMMAATANPMMAAAAMPPGPSMPMGVHAGVPMTYMQGNPTSSNAIPDVSGIGKTPHEEAVRQLEFAFSNRLFEPQDFKPADDDPSRFYYVREVDGNWTQRNRFTIDHMGDSRWYVTDEGWFYAVRLPD
ncbi:hypothetical protein E4U25_003982 [Claviceps purpurea]|nr:hypothetical protein E4U25_003982 [Claviceps purpurea]